MKSSFSARFRKTAYKLKLRRAALQGSKDFNAALQWLESPTLPRRKRQP